MTATDDHGARPDLTVVMPSFNEIMTIRRILERVDAVAIDKEIIVVDDGSGDGTRAVLADLEQRWPDESHPHSTLRVLLQPQNRGKGAAVRRGILAARGRVVIIQDADLEYDPEDYHVVVRPILEGRADVVYGSRFAGTPRRVLYFWHSLGNRLLTTVSNALTDLNLTDMETCYKAFRTDIIQRIPLTEDRFGFEPEVTAKIARLGLRIFEVPISYDGRSYAEGKKIGWRDGVEAFRVMVRHWARDDLARTDIGQHTLSIMRKSGRYNGWLFGKLEPHLGQRVLEVGSGIGNLTRRLLDRELVCATDVRADYLAALERDLGDFDNVLVERFELGAHPPQSLREHRFDTVLCCNVLEHVEDDAAALRGLGEVAEPGSTLILLVPAHPFAYGTLDEGLDHFRRYERTGLTALLERCGWKLESVESLNAVGLLGWALNSRILRRDMLPRHQVGLFEHLIPWLDFERRLDLPVGLSLLAVAHRG